MVALLPVASSHAKRTINRFMVAFMPDWLPRYGTATALCIRPWHGPSPTIAIANEAPSRITPPSNGMANTFCTTRPYRISSAKKPVTEAFFECSLRRLVRFEWPT